MWPSLSRGQLLATAIDDLRLEQASAGGMATTARISASPNMPGILSNFSELLGDVRHSNPESAVLMITQVQQAAAVAAACTFDLVERWHWGGPIFDDELITSVRATAERLEYSHMDIASQAGHDAYFLARICPTAMIFVPCVDGITHHPAEMISCDDSAAAANVLLHAVTSRADR